jgi:hypothetical protein
MTTSKRIDTGSVPTKLGRIAWHPSVTVERIVDGVEREMTTLDNPGFCLACGEEAMACEPDARFYECECCEARAVFGAAELLLYVNLK